MYKLTLPFVVQGVTVIACHSQKPATKGQVIRTRKIISLEILSTEDYDAIVYKDHLALAPRHKNYTGSCGEAVS